MIYFQEISGRYPFPQDFYSKRLMYKYGLLTDLANLSDIYWKQPEWDPQFENSEMISLIKEPYPKDQKPRFGWVGMRISPVDFGFYTNANRITATTFISSDFIVETYQGLTLDYRFPSTANWRTGSFEDGTKAVTQNPDIVSKYFKVGIETQNCNDCPRGSNTFVLEPAYPIIRNGYKGKVLVNIEIDPATPAGKYAISITGLTPDQKQNEQYYLQYGLGYVPNAWNVGNDYFTIFIEYFK
jgi:hypothetical protein